MSPYAPLSHPQMVDPTQFYLSLDPQLFIDSFKAELQFVSNSWKMVGRPTIIFPVGRSLLGASHTPAVVTRNCRIPHISRFADSAEDLHSNLISTIKKIQSGYLYGAR